MRIGFVKAINPNDIKSVILEVDLSKEHLYNDYKSGADKHGIIKKGL